MSSKSFIKIIKKAKERIYALVNIKDLQVKMNSDPFSELN